MKVCNTAICVQNYEVSIFTTVNVFILVTLLSIVVVEAPWTVVLLLICPKIVWSLSAALKFDVSHNYKNLLFQFS